MTEPSGAPSTPKRPVVVPAIGLVILTAVGVTALLGGLDTTPDKPPPQMAAGQKIDQGLYETEFVEARITVQRAASKFAEDRRYLDILFKVTNKSDTTIPTGMGAGSTGAGTGFARTLIKMTPEIKSQWGAQAFIPSGEDGKSSQLHPGVPSNVTVRYELDKAAQAPPEVALSLSKLEKTEHPLFRTTNWMPVEKEDPFTRKRTIEALYTIKAPVKQEGAP
ncbi:hypothetical protein [Nonomuraea endophytica]|uniref:Uncharacterized protein n=1 Tax=Nonomuraea endophytica TaxID=714136 RepID=A0A7W8ED87_9ACTN|nr:hypothetical protein [Nonomuraea endophytica]MBB5075264.1 hypothetical protein [Nonomuraea endophytica]